jgi:protein-tyrosine phosphatase
MGCMTQLTGASILGQFGKPAQECAQKLIDRGWATVVATDAHNLRHRPPNLDLAYKTLSEMRGEAFARQLTIDMPAKIISGNNRLSKHEAPKAAAMADSTS